MVWACGKNDEYRMARRVLMAEISGGRLRGKPRLGWMDGVKVALGNKKVKSSMARSLPVEILIPQNVGSIINYCSNVLKQPNGELLVAVNHNSYGQWRQRR